MAEIRGALEITFDDRLLTAILKCTADPEGEVWLPDRVQGWLREQGLSWTRDQNGAVLDAIKSLEGLDAGSRTVTVLEGEPAAETTDDILKWEDLDVPADLAAECERVLGAAEPPRVFDTKTTREKIEEVQTRKPALPFLKPKTETVVRWVKKEEQIEVGIDPKPEATGFVDEGGLIGTVVAGTKGRDGRNVRGEPIPARSPKRQRMLFGGGIARRGNEIRAARAGFVRRGRNWVDLIEHRGHELSVYRSPDQATCLLDFVPGTTLVPEADAILAQAGELGFSPETLISADDLRSRLADVMANGKGLRAFPLSRPSDAGFDVRVSPDSLRATVTIRKGSGEGKSLSLREVGKEINSRGFEGMNLEHVRKAILTFHSSEQKDLVDLVLVEGTPPVRGQNAAIEWAVDFLDEQRSAEVARQVGGAAADARLAFVRSGQPAATVQPAAEGTAGKDVFGKEIPAIKGNDPDLTLDEHLSLDEESGEITVLVSGLLEVIETDAGSVRARVVDYQEKEIRVVVDELRMSCTIGLIPGTGQPISEAEVRQALATQGCVKGIDEELLALVIRRAVDGEEVSDTVVARGREPVHEPPQRLRFGDGVLTARSFLVREATAERLQVKPDDVVANVPSPERKAEAGHDVLGNELPGRAAEPFEVELGENVRRDQTDAGLRFVAEKGGEVFYDGELLAIKDTRSIDGDIGAQSGDVDFSGSLTITGSVQAGRKVFCGGDVSIAGVIAAAVVSSEGSIAVGEGVKGGGKAVLRAKNVIEATYLEQATIRAVGQVRVRNSCLNCDVRCNDRVVLSGETASVVGGRIKTRNGMETGNLGSAKGVSTEVSFGQDYLVEDQIAVVEREIEKLKEQIARIDSWLRAQSERSGDASLEQKTAQVRAQKVKGLKLLERRSIRLFNLRERFEAHFDSSVTVRGTLHPGVAFESHGRTLTTETARDHVKVIFDTGTGKIRIDPIADGG